MNDQLRAKIVDVLREHDEVKNIGRIADELMAAVSPAASKETHARLLKWRVWWQGSSTPRGAYIFSVNRFEQNVEQIMYAGEDNDLAHEICRKHNEAIDALQASMKETFAGPDDRDSTLEAAARQAGWAMMETVDEIEWRKRDQVVDIAYTIACELEKADTRRAALTPWFGWDITPFSRAQHQDEVCRAVFRAPWAAEDAAMLIEFIDRTWPKAAGGHPVDNEVAAIVAKSQGDGA